MSDSDIYAGLLIASILLAGIIALIFGGRDAE